MARFLAIDWDHQQLHIVAGTMRGSTVRVQHAVVFDEAQNPYTAGPSVLGELLRDRLKDAGIAAAPVLACVGRDRIVVKDVRFPAVPPEEEPAIVRFQVVKELNEPADEVVIDYFVAADQPSSGERRAFAVVCRRNIVTTYQEMCKVAGLKLAALTPRPFGSLTCLRRQIGTTAITPPPEPADAAIAVLTVGKPWAEFCIVRGENMLFARSLTAGPGLAGEVRRNLAVYAGQAPQHPVRAVYVAGSSDFVAVRERVQEPLNIPVHPLDPFGGVEQPGVAPENRGAFAGAVGLLQARAVSTDFPVNFIAPKQPRAVRSPHRMTKLAGAAAAALLVIVGGVVCYSKLSKLDGQLSKLTGEVSNLDQQLARFRDDGARLKALDAWNQSNIVWLDELYDVTDQFPDLEKIRAMTLGGNRLQTTAKDAKGKPVARVELKVKTNDEEVVNRLNRSLDQEPHYRGEHKASPGKTTAARADPFPRQFWLHFDIEKQAPGKYTRQLPVSPTPGNRRSARPPRGAPTGGRTGE